MDLLWQLTVASPQARRSSTAVMRERERVKKEIAKAAERFAKKIGGVPDIVLIHLQLPGWIYGMLEVAFPDAEIRISKRVSTPNCFMMCPRKDEDDGQI